ncbi:MULTISPECIES: hypothetical protein [Shewanella]|uniref:Uncharacterized protein n=2 Tax=Shewanella TaxID=22 RepID=A0AAJ1BKC3_9GAMM|nr:MULTISPECIES: hypothetical protein [Shewanella]AZQ10269.1 hypothetical protein STH12_01133 [Shewanella khirikhana]MCH4296247.1 hypothetical protein [Shewanella zhuhaiensis]
MNALIDFQADRLAALIGRGDVLGIRMFMENMHIPLDVQDRLCDDMHSLSSDPLRIASWLEDNGHSAISERLSY